MTGCKVGEVEGANEGTCVMSLGAKEGIVDGMRLGAADGASDGLEDGDAVGKLSVTASALTFPYTSP
jgi:hypothetical protein